jgi:hypothetical protein
LFSSVAPSAVVVKGDANVRILFRDNVLTDTVSGTDGLQGSVVEDNLGP